MACLNSGSGSCTVKTRALPNWQLLAAALPASVHPFYYGGRRFDSKRAWPGYDAFRVADLSVIDRMRLAAVVTAARSPAGSNAVWFKRCGDAGAGILQASDYLRRLDRISCVAVTLDLASRSNDFVHIARRLNVIVRERGSAQPQWSPGLKGERVAAV